MNEFDRILKPARAILGYVLILTFGLVFFPNYMSHEMMHIEHLTFTDYLANSLIPLAIYAFGSMLMESLNSYSRKKKSKNASVEEEES